MQHVIPSGTKIFQIGFNKCATRSISVFLRRHGFKTLDWAHGDLAVSIRDAVAAGRKPLAEWPDVNVFSDMERIQVRDPIEGYKYFRDLDAAYPGAKFILNTRNMEAWIKSRHAHGDGGYTEAYRKILGAPDAKSVFDHWRRDWLRHHLDVLDYFSADRRDRLFIWNIEAPDFAALERFVGVALDPAKWPHQGRTARAGSA
ncbi:MAG: sulfotransferase [Rhodobacter sp.]|nr:sulfotransferase [Rhodobacter sp.]